MKRFLLALALLLAPAAASAQCNGVFANNTVCGNITGSSNIPRPTNPSAFLGAAGGSNGQVQYNNGGALGGIPFSANTVIGSVNGTTETSLSVPSCSAAGQSLQWTSGTGFTCVSAGGSGTTIVFPTRTAAAALNLTGFTYVKTLDYGNNVGGGAIFRNVGSAAFLDSYITTFSIQGGTGCTNGTYGAPSGSISTTAIIWNKSGNPNIAVGTATVSGNVLTAVNITNTPGNGYSVGDVLTAGGAFTGCSVQPTITVTAVSTPQASFTDSAGNHFQYMADNWPNIKQFGCIGDYNGTDASATNNDTCVRGAFNYVASLRSSLSFDSGGYWGGKLEVPSGSYMVCGSSPLVSGEGVTISGASEPGSSMFHLCDAYNGSLQAFTICDPVWGFACLGSSYRDLSFHASRSVPVASNSFMIYSNNLQDFGGLYRIYIYSGQRGGFDFEKGYGGSSYVGAEKVSINQGSPNNVMVKIGNTTASGMNFGSSIISLRDLVLGGPSSLTPQGQGGLQLLGGAANVQNVHCENINQFCIFVNIPNDGNNLQTFLLNINSQGCASGGTCDGVVTLGSENIIGNTTMGMIWAGSGYTHLINNGQPSGASTSTPITNFARFNPSFVQP
jgi:hypothetical protein